MSTEAQLRNHRHVHQLALAIGPCLEHTHLELDLEAHRAIAGALISHLNAIGNDDPVLLQNTIGLVCYGLLPTNKLGADVMADLVQTVHEYWMRSGHFE